MANLDVPTMDDVREAAEFLNGKINRTPLFHSTSFSKKFDSEIYFKMENLQKTGSFKTRGALFRVSKLTGEERKRGVITASAGNHAQGVAYSAMVNGINAKIVMPEIATPAKIDAVDGYGAEIVLHGKDYAEARVVADQIAKEENRVFIEAFNDKWIISGQGTVSMEILEDQPDIDTIIVPIGGGGLISGVALAAKAIRPDIRIIGVEAENYDSMRESVRTGRIVDHTTGDSIADGITVKYPGELNLDIVSKYVDEIVTVSDESISFALFKLLERNKVLVEPSGAVGFAAILDGKIDVKGRKVAVILSGGNINMLLLSKIIYKSLETENKLVRIECKIPDRPGTLHRISKAISDSGANIYHAEVDNLVPDTPPGYQSIMFTVNVRGKNQLDRLLEQLKKIGYRFQVKS